MRALVFTFAQYHNSLNLSALEIVILSKVGLHWICDLHDSKQLKWKTSAIMNFFLTVASEIQGLRTVEIKKVSKTNSQVNISLEIIGC